MILVRRYKQPKPSSVNWWINTVWHIHTVKYYLALKGRIFQYMLCHEWTLRTVCYVKWTRHRRTNYYMIPLIFKNFLPVLHSSQDISFLTKLNPRPQQPKSGVVIAGLAGNCQVWFHIIWGIKRSPSHRHTVQRWLPGAGGGGVGI